MAKKFAHMARELSMATERLAEKEEQVEELKSERSNTRVSPCVGTWDSVGT